MPQPDRSETRPGSHSPPTPPSALRAEAWSIEGEARTTTVSWEEVKRRVDEQRKAAGIPVRSPEEKQADMERLLAEVRAYKLAEIRREQDLTQRDIADSMGVSTPRISAIEHGEIDRTEVATLRAYVRALGGELRVVADFGGAAYTVG